MWLNYNLRVKELLEMTFNQNYSVVTTEMKFTIEENYFVNKIHSQIQRHLTTMMDDSLFEGLLSLGMGTINPQGFSKVCMSCFKHNKRVSSNKY